MNGATFHCSDIVATPLFIPCNLARQPVRPLGAGDHHWLRMCGQATFTRSCFSRTIKDLRGWANPCAAKRGFTRLGESTVPGLPCPPEVRARQRYKPGGRRGGTSMVNVAGIRSHGTLGIGSAQA
ncbi:hypothetical protein FE257_004346 [Aspergillus nanangensis]|uniref:Uncharacterized protein n=1 Tax=Aspergillus nanangensis TaxID=2582783 RepID=A0AAD4CAS2_ASPNN|nr:hypothetical protein FE257_004346 [Aspergillus nanangensis]